MGKLAVDKLAVIAGVTQNLRTVGSQSHDHRTMTAREQGRRLINSVNYFLSYVISHQEGFADKQGYNGDDRQPENKAREMPDSVSALVGLSCDMGLRCFTIHAKGTGFRCKLVSVPDGESHLLFYDEDAEKSLLYGEIFGLLYDFTLLTSPKFLSPYIPPALAPSCYGMYRDPPAFMDDIRKAIVAAASLHIRSIQMVGI